MHIRTDLPLFPNRHQITKKIQQFWNHTSLCWREIWGQHIHHGYYELDEALSPAKAQEKLIVKLTDMLQLKPHSRVLDAGCGMGGSSVYLAKHFAAKVVGITLSHKQVSIAKQYAQQENLSDISFLVADALELEDFKAQSFDVIWSLESCEQFHDKARFIQQAHRLLKPNGQLLIATWCSDREAYDGSLAKRYQALCQIFDLPFMPTIAHYEYLLKQSHFKVEQMTDWSNYVTRSWDVGLDLLRARDIFYLLRLGGFTAYRFAKKVRLMRDAFHEGQVQYGVFVARKLAST